MQLTCSKLLKATAILLIAALAAILLLWLQPATGLIQEASAATVTGNEWNTPTVVSVGQIPSRALIIPFDTAASAKGNPTLKLAQENSSNVIMLNGTWKFHYARNPAAKPDIAGVTEIPASFFDITVPSSWQTNMQYAGWKSDSTNDLDWPLYSNQEYPWQASGDGVSAQSAGSPTAPSTFNPVGTYMRIVNIKPADIGKRFIITFQGVESGFYLYVNGTAVGYGEDSFTPSEFDITEFLHEGDNTIAAQVYRWTTGSYIENQDMLNYAGIHRDAYITVQPKISIVDYNVETLFANHNFSSAELSLKVDVENTSEFDAEGYSVAVFLYDTDGQAVSTGNGVTAPSAPSAGARVSSSFSIPVQTPALWSAELPNLYTLVMELRDNAGNPVQAVSKRVGFREFYVYNAGTTNSTSYMAINGQNIEFYGVNRGDADPAGGHHVPYATLVKDIESAKRLNINAIRTSHFPPDAHMIELCDEYGIYVMDEVNVESHNGRTGVGMSGYTISGTSSGSFPGDDSRYTNAMKTRMTSMVMRDKNNASVLIYSLGNEAGNGANFNSMIDVIKELDADKLVHYQGDNGNARVDLVGYMYPENYSQSSPTNSKPYITMEYQHSMGNTGGDLNKYTNVFEADARRQGGFIWDYVDQSAYTPLPGLFGPGLTRDKLFFGFGGSWKQAINQTGSHSGNFCANGFINPDRTWQPEAYEVKANYQDLKFSQTTTQQSDKQVLLKNFNRFKNANFYDITWSILENGAVIQSGTLTDAEADLAPPTGNIAAGSSKAITIPYSVPSQKDGAEYLLLLEYKLKEASVYAPAGYVQGSGQFALPASVKGKDVFLSVEELPELTTESTEGSITVSGTTENNKAFQVVFSKTSGKLEKYVADGKDLISKGPTGSFFRAETDQSAATEGGSYSTTSREAYDAWFDQGETLSNVIVNSISSDKHMTQVLVSATLPNGSAYETSYTVYGNGTIIVKASLTPSADSPMQLGEYGMLMNVPSEFENMTWYGRGPTETYWDRKAGAYVGVWNGTVTDQFFPYIRVSETGNKTDVRWVALRNESGAGLLASMTYGEGYSGTPLEAVALHYTPAALSSYHSKIRYPYQAAKTDDVVLRLLTHQKGVGNLDWNDDPKDALVLKTNAALLDYSYTLMPLFADTDPMEKSKEIIGVPPVEALVNTIKINGKNLDNFEQDVFSYDVKLGSIDPLPILSATGPSFVTFRYEQPTAVPGSGKVIVEYKGNALEYVINFTKNEPLSGAYLSDIVELPSLNANGKSTVTDSSTGKLLYAYSGYSGIFKNVDRLNNSLMVRGGTVYPKGFAGNAYQIIDIDISSYSATNFNGIVSINCANGMKNGNGTSSIIFEVWVHKDVSALTTQYYSGMNPSSTGGTIVTTGWTKIANTAVIGGSTNPYTFNNLLLTYDDGGTTKSYQAIRLVMNSNGSNSHDEGIWAMPQIIFPAVGEGEDEGFGTDPDPSLTGIKVNGVLIPDFDVSKTEYEFEVNYGAAKAPVIEPVYDPNLYLTVSQASELPGTASIVRRLKVITCAIAEYKIAKLRQIVI